MDLEPPRLQARNVEVFDHKGVVIAGFWQYGTLQWDEFYRYLGTFVVATTATWTIFQLDPTNQRRGVPCPPGAHVVQPGYYILFSSAGEPVRVGLVPPVPRPHNPTHSSIPGSEPHYRNRGRARDGRCLFTGLQTETYSRLKVAHIFPPEQDAEWICKGYPSKITDMADEAQMGGQTKIDSVQNVITMRSDLHDAWVNYEFGVDPSNNYRVTAFTNGNADIDGLYLQLDHIQDPTLRPLDELLTDHFIQGVSIHMNGAGESERTHDEYDDIFGEGSFNLSNFATWGSREAKESFERILPERLFDLRVWTHQE
ncbi:hypothetical protein BU15DRAFT_82827 [Melanogaster broomeanus]|nr:hypothetical protein BU15DRAFT_82827 [Melanogaster broomeanus]